jgi:hypothetical protein
VLAWHDMVDVWKNQYLTPNPDTIYFMPFFNTKDLGLFEKTWVLPDIEKVK